MHLILKNQHTSTYYYSSLTHKFFCELCLSDFGSEQLLNVHYKYCKRQSFPQSVYCPTEENALCKFCNYKKSLHCPFVIIADIEAILVSAPSSTNFNVLHIHKPISVGFQIISFHPNYDGTNVCIYKGESCLIRFLTATKDEMDIMHAYISNICPMIALTGVEMCNCNSEVNCFICQEQFSGAGALQKVQDHCHMTGLYRSAVHSSCNVNLRFVPHRMKIPVFFHNGRKYDSHMLIKAMSHFDHPINVIPKNMELYHQIL